MVRGWACERDTFQSPPNHVGCKRCTHFATRIVISVRNLNIFCLINLRKGCLIMDTFMSLHSLIHMTSYKTKLYPFKWTQEEGQLFPKWRTRIKTYVRVLYTQF
uniref:Uncharacterized protein n=1 Tax=Schistocephalus solidus TaxID=70667 RepID=A0A0X3P3V7_SCHSO